jgi:hypothetical protein
LLCSPQKSLKKLSLQSGLSYVSIHKATNILELHPYCVHVTHELKEHEKEQRNFTTANNLHTSLERVQTFLVKFSIVKKHSSTQVDILIAKTAEYGGLKICIPPMKHFLKVRV